MNTETDSALFVDALQKRRLFGPGLFPGPFHLDGQQIAELHGAFADNLHTLGKNAENVGHAAKADETAVAAVFQGDRT